MHSTSDPVLMLHHVRLSELKNGAVRGHAAGQAHIPGFPLQGITVPSDRSASSLPGPVSSGLAAVLNA